TSAQSTVIWVKVGYQNNIDNGRIYYTTDGSTPDGSFARGRGTTQLITLGFDHPETEAGGVVAWWKGTIPAQANGAVVKYKLAMYDEGINPISDANTDKIYGASEFSILSFDPTTARVWTHGDLNTNSTRLGLEEGFHIVRARAFLPRSGKASIY